MARVKVTLNRAEVGRLLRTAFTPELSAVARVVVAAAGHKGHRKDVRLRWKVTDRQVAEISVPAYRQAKYGALSKGAAAAELRVRGKL
ncbi:hypothetical protein [Nocardia farcinica]|uniref:hypothetical protein n=1 Tax=Nocardia farcinica TaxID=37329 RepID=UPI0024541F91|nr:hypothetical protein [Nocardia farcinica]